MQNLKVTNPRANGCRGPAAVAPRLEVEGRLSAAPRGTGGSWAPREARDSEKTRELEVLAQRRNFGPGSQERTPRAQSSQTARRPELAPRTGVYVAGTECRNPSPAQKRLGHYVVPSAILAALSRGPSWGEGSGAHSGDLRGDPGSRRALAQRNSPSRTALGAHLVAPERRSRGTKALAGPNLKGLPGPLPQRALRRRGPG